MNTKETFKKAAEAYRDFPLLDAKFIDEATRMDCKRIFGLILSRDRLLESIKECFNPELEYREDTPFLATLTTRLKDVESQLKSFEGKYGCQLSDYTTIQA